MELSRVIFHLWNDLDVGLLHLQMMLNLCAVEAKIKIQSDADHLKCLKLIECNAVNMEALLQGHSQEQDVE